MCIHFTCRSCHLPCMIYCASVDIYASAYPTCTLPTINPTPLIPKKICETCKTIYGVGDALRTLVFQNPWLETEGLAGLATKEDWEVGPGIKRKEAKSIWSRGRVDEEDKIVENLERMGLGGLEGREALNEGESWDDDDRGREGGKKKKETTAKKDEAGSSWGIEAGTLVEEEGESTIVVDGKKSEDEMLVSEMT